MSSGWILTLRNFFIIVLKNAVNALIVNVGAWWILPANFNFHNSAAIWNIVKLAAITVLAKETAVWLPELLKWSNTNANPSALQDSLNTAVTANKAAASAMAAVQTHVDVMKAAAPNCPPVSNR